MEILPLILVWRVTSIFAGFTFTSPVDFMPLFSLTIGVGTVFVSHRSRAKASLSLVLSMLVLSLWLILPNLGLFFLAREVQATTGSWPQVMIDDPKNLVGNISPYYDALYDVVDYLEAFSGAWMVVLLALFFGAQARFSKAQRWLLLGLNAVALVFFVVDSRPPLYVVVGLNVGVSRVLSF